MKKSSSTEIRIKILSATRRLLPQFFSQLNGFFKPFFKDTEQSHCAESLPSCQAFCWSSLRYHLFTSPHVPCALGSFGLRLNSKWEETAASPQELLTGDPGGWVGRTIWTYKKAVLQNSLRKLYSHVNWSKIFTSDQEVLYFLMKKQVLYSSR